MVSSAGLFPGFANVIHELHKHPRWEGFEFAPMNGDAVNPFRWLGVCMTRGEIDKTDSTPYLKSVDIPPIPDFALQRFLPECTHDKCQGNRHIDGDAFVSA